MTEFKRENRYLVFKRSEIEEYLTPGQRTQLNLLANICALCREEDDKIPLECVITESDWDCYEDVWALVEQEWRNKND